MKKNILSKFNKEPFFTKESLKSYSNITDGSLSYNIGRWLKTGDLIALKNGVYATEKAYMEYSRYPRYKEYISSILRKPSYISLETILNEHDMLSEIAQITTSVTNKVGRTYSNKLGGFRYRNIKEELFLGFHAELFANEYTYYVASKSKALFDFLYYRVKLLPGNLDSFDIVEEFRMNLEDMNKRDWKEFNEYVKISKDKRMYNISKQISK